MISKIKINIKTVESDLAEESNPTETVDKTVNENEDVSVVTPSKELTTEKIDEAKEAVDGEKSSVSAPLEKSADSENVPRPSSESSTDCKPDAKDCEDSGGGGQGDVKYEYEGEDVYYTDPATKVRYKWDKEKNGWSSESGEITAPSNQQQPPSDKYEFDGETYVYRDEKGTKHRWNKDTNKWEEQEDSEESEEDDNTTDEQRRQRQYRKRKAAPGWESKKYETDPVSGKTVYKDPVDGMTYEWDEEKKAWFPQIGEDFMAAYQLNYGFTNDLESKPTMPEPEVEKPPPPEKQPKSSQKKAEKKAPEWFEEDESKSTKVYVSGLPSTITDEEFEQFVSKCGMVEHDIRTKKSKLKLYKDESGVPKGDGWCSYIKPESVSLALAILDGSDFKGNKVSVERAKFQQKGNYDPKLKPKKLNKKERERRAKHQERLFAWVPDKMKGERAKYEKVVVIKNLFEPKEFARDPGRILDITSQIRQQCSKFGACTKVVLYDKHEEGVCQVFFREPLEADMAVQMMNGRLFGKRLMTVTTWDGKTKYKRDESKEEEQARLASWEEFLQGENEDEKKEDDKSDKMEEGIGTSVTSSANPPGTADNEKGPSSVDYTLSEPVEESSEQQPTEDNSSEIEPSDAGSSHEPPTNGKVECEAMDTS